MKRRNKHPELVATLSTDIDEIFAGISPLDPETEEDLEALGLTRYFVPICEELVEVIESPRGKILKHLWGGTITLVVTEGNSCETVTLNPDESMSCHSIIDGMIVEKTDFTPENSHEMIGGFDELYDHIKFGEGS